MVVHKQITRSFAPRITKFYGRKFFGHKCARLPSALAATPISYGDLEIVLAHLFCIGAFQRAGALHQPRPLDRSRLNLAPYCQSFRANFSAKWLISLS
jgi:hypothetical protein